MARVQSSQAHIIYNSTADPASIAVTEPARWPVEHEWHDLCVLLSIQREKHIRSAARLLGWAGHDGVVESLEGLACEVSIQMLPLLDESYVSSCVVGCRGAGLLALEDDVEVVELLCRRRGGGGCSSFVHVVGLETFACWCFGRGVSFCWRAEFWLLMLSGLLFVDDGLEKGPCWLCLGKVTLLYPKEPQMRENGVPGSVWRCEQWMRHWSEEAIGLKRRLVF